MRKILLERAKIGMVLAGNAAAADGRVLAPAGAKLDDAMLERLNLAGVKELVVQGATVSGTDVGYDARTRAGRVKHLFRAYQNDNFMVALQELLHKHFTARA